MENKPHYSWAPSTPFQWLIFVTSAVLTGLVVIGLFRWDGEPLWPFSYVLGVSLALLSTYLMECKKIISPLSLAIGFTAIILIFAAMVSS